MTKKKDKTLPQRIWLDADSCWTEKPQGEGYTEYIRKDIVEKELEKLLKLPKWKRVKNPQPCWSGEIGVDPIRGQFQYENWVISANKLFKLLDKEDAK